MQRVVGGVELEIEYLPESYFEADELAEFSQELLALLGTKAAVMVRQFRAKWLDRYLDIQGNERALVELYCAPRPAGWADILSPDSYTLVAKTGQELNLPFFLNWRERLDKTSEAVNPGLAARAAELGDEVMRKKAEELMEAASPSPTSAEKSPPATG